MHPKLRSGFVEQRGTQHSGFPRRRNPWDSGFLYMDHRITRLATWRPAFDSGKLYYHKLFQAMPSILQADIFQSSFREGSLTSSVSVAQKHLPSQISVLFRSEHDETRTDESQENILQFQRSSDKISQDAQYISHKQQWSDVLQVVYEETSFFPESLFVLPFPRSTPYLYVAVVLSEVVTRYPLYLRYIYKFSSRAPYQQLIPSPDDPQIVTLWIMILIQLYAVAVRSIFHNWFWENAPSTNYSIIHHSSAICKLERLIWWR